MFPAVSAVCYCRKANADLTWSDSPTSEDVKLFFYTGSTDEVKRREQRGGYALCTIWAWDPCSTQKTDCYDDEDVFFDRASLPDSQTWICWEMWRDGDRKLVQVLRNKLTSWAEHRVSLNAHPEKSDFINEAQSSVFCSFTCKLHENLFYAYLKKSCKIKQNIHKINNKFYLFKWTRWPDVNLLLSLPLLLIYVTNSCVQWCLNKSCFGTDQKPSTLHRGLGDGEVLVIQLFER